MGAVPLRGCHGEAGSTELWAPENNDDRCYAD